MKDLALVALDANTGKKCWVATYGARTKRTAEEAFAMAVGSDGKIYVTGSFGNGETFDQSSRIEIGTAAFGARGARLWVNVFSRGSHRTNGRPSAIAVSSTGKRLFVTADIGIVGIGAGFGTIAYASTGRQLWFGLYEAPNSSSSKPASLVVSSDDQLVLVTGTSGPDFSTVAYGAAKGTRLWARQSNCDPGAPSVDEARSAALSSDGKTAYVVGSSQYPWGSTSSSCGPTDRFVVEALNVADGSPSWSVAVPIGVDPVKVLMSEDGSDLFVTGSGRAGIGITQFETVDITTS